MMWRSTGQFLNVVVPIWQKFYDIPRFRKWKGKPRFFACTKTLEGNAIMWLMSKFLERKKLLEPLLAINPSPAVSGKKKSLLQKTGGALARARSSTRHTTKKNLCLPFVKLAGSCYVHSRHWALLDSSCPLFRFMHWYGI